MDFWAQHKDFVLRILAGLGVFLVALIARGIVYGDELEDGLRKNRQFASSIRNKKLAPRSDVSALQRDGEKLEQQAAALAAQIGWDVTDETLQMDLLKRILGYLRRFRDADDVRLTQEANSIRAAIRDNLNGGFGQLRLMVRDELLDEANVENVGLQETGFENVVSLEQGELLKYLLQLELVTRVLRYAIDARVQLVESIRIETRDMETIPGGNPEFLREYPVTFQILGSQPAWAEILNRLQSDAPAAPLRAVKLERAERPLDHLLADFTVVAVAVDPGVAFAAPEQEESR